MLRDSAISCALGLDNFQTQRYSSAFGLLGDPSRFQLIETSVQELSTSSLGIVPNFVIHLGGTTDAMGTANDPDRVWRNNLSGTQSVIDFCVTNNIGCVFVSSTSVYGSADAVVDESCVALNPQSPYAECKLAEEALISEAIQIQGLRCVIYRFGTISGASPGMRFHTAVNKFCWQAVNRQPITVWRTALDQVRPYPTALQAIRFCHSASATERFAL